MRLPEFDRLPENPPAPRRPDPEEPTRPDEFATELHRANTPPPPRRPLPTRPEEPSTPEKSSVKPRAVKDAPRKPRHDEHDPPPAPQNPTAAPAPTPTSGTGTGTGTGTDTDTATVTVTATATATATATKTIAAVPATPDDTAALDDSQIPAAEPTTAAASALSLTAALPDILAGPTAAATAPATAATDKPAANPLAAAIDEARDASVTIAFSTGGGGNAAHTGSNGASADSGSKDSHAADALLGMRLGAPVRPLGRATGFTRFEGELAPGILPRSQLHDGPPRVALPTLPIERPEAAEPTDPAAQPGHHRADLTVGDGDQKIVVSVMASEHQVRVHARAVSGDETAALRAGADELRGALKKQGLELAYLGAETMGGRASQEQGPGRGPQRDESRQTNNDTGLTPVDDSVETARPDVRVIA